MKLLATLLDDVRTRYPLDQVKPGVVPKQFEAALVAAIGA